MKFSALINPKESERLQGGGIQFLLSSLPLSSYFHPVSQSTIRQVVVRPLVENITDTKNFTIFEFYVIKSTIFILQVVTLNASIKPKIQAPGSFGMVLSNWALKSTLGFNP